MCSVDALARGILALEAAGHSPSAISMYDEAWAVQAAVAPFLAIASGGNTPLLDWYTFAVHGSGKVPTYLVRTTLCTPPRPTDSPCSSVPVCAAGMSSVDCLYARRVIALGGLGSARLLRVCCPCVPHRDVAFRPPASMLIPHSLLPALRVLPCPLRGCLPVWVVPPP